MKNTGRFELLHLFSAQSGVEPGSTSVKLAPSPRHVTQHSVFECFVLLSYDTRIRYTTVFVMKTVYVLCEVGTEKIVI